MRRPIRLNRAIWPAMMDRLQRGIPDPRRLLDQDLDASALTEILKRMKIGTTYKTTQYDRFPETTRLLAALPFTTPPVVLDVGASDGSTALAVMRHLAFSRYYVTDMHIQAQAFMTRRGMFLCDGQAQPWLYVNRGVVVFNDLAGARWPFRSLAAWVFAGFNATRWPERRDIFMVNPELASLRGQRIHIERYNVFEAWRHEQADLVVAANLLNRSYFSDAQLRDALGNLRAALREGGRLAVIENRTDPTGAREQASLFRRVGDRLRAEARVGAGSDIHDLVDNLA